MVLATYVGERKRSVLLLKLKERLADRRMIYSKEHIQLSSTIGQGKIHTHIPMLFFHSATFFRRVRIGVQGLHQNCNRN